MSPEKKDAFILISQHEHCAVKQDKENQQHGLFASRPFLAGEVIVAFNASKIVDTPNYLTVQVSEHKHIHLSPEYLQYVNHCCEPNVLFNTTTMQLECISDIEADEELRFFYPATEWRISQQFVCNCGKPSCVGLIQGAADTPTEVLNKYKLTDFIKSMAARYKAFLLML
jgi:hypothetical protein